MLKKVFLLLVEKEEGNKLLLCLFLNTALGFRYCREREKGKKIPEQTDLLASTAIPSNVAPVFQRKVMLRVPELGLKTVERRNNSSGRSLIKKADDLSGVIGQLSWKEVEILAEKPN